jgi:hypothetical protein
MSTLASLGRAARAGVTSVEPLLNRHRRKASPVETHTVARYREWHVVACDGWHAHHTYTRTPLQPRLRTNSAQRGEVNNAFLVCCGWLATPSLPYELEGMIGQGWAA